jgi:hypothetical protein
VENLTSSIRINRCRIAFAQILRDEREDIQGQILFEMKTQDAPSLIKQCLVIAQGLGKFQVAKAEAGV